MEEVIDGILLKYAPNNKENLLLILQEIQKEVGHLSGESLSVVSKHLNLPLNRIYGVATFYDQFHFQKRGTFHIKVCEGTACYLDQSALLLSHIEKHLKIAAGQTTRDGKFSIELVSCLGACGKGPAISINGKLYSQLTKESITGILSSL